MKNFDGMIQTQQWYDKFRKIIAQLGKFYCVTYVFFLKKKS